MILVTGGTGLVGAHLLLHLIESHNIGSGQIRAIYRSSGSIEKTKSLFKLYRKFDLFDSIQWVQADITDVPALEHVFVGITKVYHCAAIISFDPKDEEKIRKINIEGTANIVNFCLSYKVKKLCYISSIAALGDIAAHESIITEETDWNPEKPHSDYAISKYGAEMEMWRGQQEGLNILIVNPGVILGPGFQDQGSGVLFKRVANGLSYYTLGTTGFIAVTDVVKITTKLMDSDTSNERFTLIAENIIYRDLFNSIADSLNVQRPMKHAKPFFMEIVWRVDWILSVIFGQKRKFTKATAKASYCKNLYSNQKIKERLNPKFTNILEYVNTIANLKP
ncbi:NAD-dependent epimerase/dehydratase family protein [Flavobacterium weaverense]|uniref:Nucleoside-diphosphate-sugar epimerase n=1 Tax=Flavobacterium weaverense TaxID=271156 RepID=A0A3L9ZX44_9FLAO|nr:NAD-dependent epimerase/dehydratase family protein [Flavobacterium weaverense]RMA77273.1 nucleoside-diphosphate-sugar epimerase [Flavobacterium weaverense]